MTEHEALTKLRFAMLDGELQAKWRREHKRALVWSWVKGWTIPLACVGMALYAVWEVLKP